MNLSKKKCIPCEDNKVKPLAKKQAMDFLKQISGWKLSKNTKEISKHWLFDDFVVAMKFINKVAKIAEREGHHPDMSISYNKVSIELSTHSIKGLSENDFIVAAKIDQL